MVILAEPDRALRELMRRAIASAGYRVSECASALELEAALRSQEVFCSRGLLFLLTARFAQECAMTIRGVNRIRQSRGLPSTAVQLTCEFGELSLLSPPELGPCSYLSVLEKPFDLSGLLGIARRCLPVLNDEPCAPR